PVFVFLDLLRRHAEMAAELGLRQSALQTTDPDIASNQKINAHRLFRHVISSRERLPRRKFFQASRSQLAGSVGDPSDEAALHASEDTKGRMVAGAWQDGQQRDVASAPFARRLTRSDLLARDIGHPKTFHCVPECTQVPIERVSRMKVPMPIPTVGYA